MRLMRSARAVEVTSTRWKVNLPRPDLRASARFARRPDDRSSTATTSSPSLNNRSTRWEPINPAAPVTRTRTSPPSRSARWAAMHSRGIKRIRPAIVGCINAEMEAIILAGGKAERLGEAAGGMPKALVEIAGRPLAAYQIRLLAGAGVSRIIVSCAQGQADLFEDALGDLGVPLTCAAEPEPLGRGGGLKFAAEVRSDEGPVIALN